MHGILEAVMGSTSSGCSLVTSWCKSSIFPEWRKAIIKPIFKGGKKDRRDPSSYRPISLTSCVVRTMEKLLNARIFEYLKKNCFFKQHQSGFQQNHSTVTQLCFLVHQWHMALEEGANVQSVFLDSSKAYDRISINSL